MPWNVDDCFNSYLWWQKRPCASSDCIHTVYHILVPLHLMHAISFCISFPQIIFATLRCIFDTKVRNLTIETKWMNIIILQIVKWQGFRLTHCHDRFLKILHCHYTWSSVTTSSQVSKRSLYYVSMYLLITAVVGSTTAVIR